MSDTVGKRLRFAPRPTHVIYPKSNGNTKYSLNKRAGVKLLVFQNTNQPKNDDAVKGGDNPLQISSAVLEGLSGH